MSAGQQRMIRRPQLQRRLQLTDPVRRLTIASRVDGVDVMSDVLKSLRQRRQVPCRTVGLRDRFSYPVTHCHQQLTRGSTLGGLGNSLGLRRGCRFVGLHGPQAGFRRHAQPPFLRPVGVWKMTGRDARLCQRGAVRVGQGNPRLPHLTWRYASHRAVTCGFMATTCAQ